MVPPFWPAPDRVIEALVECFVQAELAEDERRTLILRALPAQIRALLPRRARPIDQVRSDLTELYALASEGQPEWLARFLEAASEVCAPARPAEAVELARRARVATRPAGDSVWLDRIDPRYLRAWFAFQNRVATHGTDQRPTLDLRVAVIHPALIEPPRSIVALMSAAHQTTEGHLARAWLIVGPRGSGKSMAACRLSGIVIARRVLPVLVNIGRWLEQQDLFDHILVQMSRFSAVPRFPAESFINLLRRAASHGDLHLIFDGLDELPPRRAEIALMALEALADRFPKCLISVFGRETTRDIEGFGRARLLPLDERQCQELCMSLGVDAGEARALTALIHRYPEPRDVLLRPMMVAIIGRLGAVWYAGQTVRVFPWLLGVYLKRVLERMPHPRGHARLLGAWAWAMMIESEDEEWGDAAVERVLRRLSESRASLGLPPGDLYDALGAVVRATGLVVQTASDGTAPWAGRFEATWRFSHPAYRVFFCAEALAREGRDVLVEQVEYVLEADGALDGYWADALATAIYLQAEVVSPVEPADGYARDVLMEWLPDALHPALSRLLAAVELAR